MLVTARWRAASVTGATASMCLLMAAAGALGSARSAPVLKSPRNGQRVQPGSVSLVVSDPGLPKSLGPIYVRISPKRSVDHFGHLSKCASGCYFVRLVPWRHHPGQWIYHPLPGFPGYWAVTPGRYYWQADHTAPLALCPVSDCEIVSAIHSFRVG